MTREGKCACGQLVVRCEGEPDVVAMCHCFDCQRRTGSVFSVHAWFSASHVSLPKIGFGQFSRKANSGREVRFGFCHNSGGLFFGKRICDQVLLRLLLEPSPTPLSRDQRKSILLIGNIAELRTLRYPLGS